MLLHGIGTEPDVDRAHSLFHKAADRGHPYAKKIIEGGPLELTREFINESRDHYRANK